MIGYKATDLDCRCRGFQFELGKTYTKNTPKEDLECCTDKVFHFCREFNHVWNYYNKNNSRVFEVVTGAFVKNGNIYGTNEITLIREIKGDELKDLLNSGTCNSGTCNSGNRNSGDYNSGNWNSGNRNSGVCNSGDCNSGYRNSGDRNSGNCNSGAWNSGTCNSGDCNPGHHNSGDRNSGNWNSGNRNSGDYNSGNWNSGYRNSGDRNSGNCNSGAWNSGTCNSGNWNSGNRNSGYFNIDEPNVRIFGKETELKREDINFPFWLYFDLIVWVSHDTATEEEKEKYKKEIETSGGFLKTLEYKDAFKLAYNKADDEGKIQLFNLPNFDKTIFKEISGIDVTEDYNRLIKE